MPTDTTVALIAAAASVVVGLLSLGGTVWSLKRSAKANRELELLKSGLAAENDAAKAKRDYEYDARKRLYADLYPLAFQLNELALSAINRVKNISLATRGGYLSPGPDNWIASRDGYYFNSTLYSLLSPLAVYHLMSKKLTLFDLNLDRNLHRQHFLAKKAYQCFRSDFDFADPTRYPSIVFGQNQYRYNPPEVRDDAPLTAVEERWKWRQGLYSGQVGQAVEALLVNDGTDAGGRIRQRVMSYAEFANSLAGEDLRFTKTCRALIALGPIVEIFRDFHPERRPVTWRILIAQAGCYRALLNARDPSCRDEEILGKAALFPDTEKKDFNWLSGAAGGATDGVATTINLQAEIDAAYEVGQKFVENALKEFVRDYPLIAPGKARS